MNLKLEWSNEQTVYEIEPALIAKLEELLRLAGGEEGVEGGEVALMFVDDERIRELNRDYRGIDRPTDVLSFAMREAGEDEIAIVFGDDDDYEVIEESIDGEAEETEETEETEEAEFAEPLGDIVISVPRAIEQSEEYGHSVQRELGFLFVHGFLHLLGYDHGSEDEEKAMFDKQESILLKAGLIR